MLGNYLIGLREGLEAVLIVSILIGAFRRIGRRDLLPQLWLGVGLATVLSLAVGALISFGVVGLEEETEEIIAGGLSIVAVAFVTGMIFWMARNSRGLAAHLRGDVDRTVAAAGAGAGVVLLAFLSVGREGVETSVFLWAAAQGANSTLLASLGAILGIATAIGLGLLISRGLVRFDLGKFFAITGAFLILIAAGVLSHGVGDLQAAHLLPGSGAVAYDITGTVAPDSVLATLAGGVLGVSTTATWLEVAVWFAYAAVVGAGFFLAMRRPRTAPNLAAAPAR
ncbi:MAG: high-affinity iron transporter [Microbacteriaceae bacterium]|nr:high-affinity iron transporter [Microbacteriaceae bacterium]